MPEEEMLFYKHNRALQYNDGFFETIIIRDGKICFWQDHLDRMRRAAGTLKIELPQELTDPDFSDLILKLALRNDAYHYGRVKIKVWRSGAGLYTPETNKAEWVATAQAASPPSSHPLSIGVCQQVRTIFSPFSFFKGPNSLLYVMAGIEKKERQLDDMLLLDQEAHAAELISSNLFWLSGNTLYTPPLSTGCLDGIMRRNVLSCCPAIGLETEEAKAGVEALLKAEAVFSTNVTGIRMIGRIEETNLNTSNLMVDRLQETIKVIQSN